MADSLQEYGIGNQVATYDPGTPSQPYSYTGQIQSQADAYLNRNAPQFPTPTAGAPNGGQAPAQPGADMWTQRLAAAISAKGGLDKFTPDDFAKVRDGFKVEVTPHLFARKLTDKGVEAALADFDRKAAEDAAKLFPAGGGGDATAPNKDNGMIGEAVANIAGGAAQALPGAMALVDYGIRGAGAVGNYLSALEGHPTNYSTARTAIGDKAASISEGINKAVQSYNTAEATQQAQEIQAAIAKDPSLANVISQYFGKGRLHNLLTITEGGVGSVLGPAGEIKLASMIPRVGRYLRSGSDLAKLARFSTVAGAPMSGVQGLQLEQRIAQTPLEDLLKDNPEVAQTYNTALAMNVPQAEAEKTARTAITNRALEFALPAYLAGNVGLELAGGAVGLGGATQALQKRILGQSAESAADAAKHGFIRRVATGAASEGLVQEGGAAVLQSAGENYGLNRPLDEGMAANVVPSVAAGALIGMAIHAPGGGHKAPAVNDANAKLGDKLKKRQAAPETPPAGADGTPPPPGTPPAGTVEASPVTPYAGAPAEGLAPDAFTKFADDFNATLDSLGKRIKDRAKTIADPAEAIARAQILAQDIAQDDWASLDSAQRLDLVDRVATEFSKSKAIPGLSEALLAHRTQVIAPAAQVQETGEVQVPPTQALPTGEVPAQENKVGVVPAVDNTIQPAPAVTPPVQQAAPMEDKIKALTAKRRRLVSDFGYSPDQARATSMDTIDAELEKAATAKEAQRAADAQAAQDKANKPAQVKNDNSFPFVQSMLAYLADKPNLVEGKYQDAITRHPQLEQIRAAYKAGKITTPSQLQNFLGTGEMPAEVADTTKAKKNGKKPVKVETKVDAKPIAPAGRTFALPADLEGAKPRYSFGEKQFTLKFESALDKALYIVAGKSLSKSDAKYIKAITEGTNITAEQARELGKQVRESIKALAGKAKAGELSIPAVYSSGTQTESTPPKQQAPAAQPGAKPESNAPKASKKTKTELTAKQQIQKRFLSLRASEVNKLIDAVQQAREGVSGVLNETIKEATDAELINHDDAVWLRKLASDKPKTAAKIHEDEIAAIIADAANEDPSVVQVAENSQAEMELDHATGVQLEDSNSKTPIADATLEDVLRILRPQETVRGLDKIVAKLQSLRANPKMRAGVDFALWLIEGNPNVVNNLALRLDVMKANGSYSPFDRLIKLDQSGFSKTTVVHEFMHHLERMLPSDIQNKIRTEYAARLMNKLKQAERNGDENAVAYLNAVKEYILNPTEENKKAAIDFIYEGKVDASEYYKYFNPSEYFAETATEILNRRYKDGSWVAQLKEWLSNFAEKFKATFGLKNNYSVMYSALDTALKGGEFQSKTMVGNGAVFFEDARTGVDESPEDAENDQEDAFTQTDEQAKTANEKIKADVKAVRTEAKAGLFQHAWENLSNNVLSFEEVEIGLRKLAGAILNIDNSPSWNYRIYNGRVSQNNKVDRAQVMQPAIDWVDSNWTQFAHDKPSFIEALNRYFGNTNFLERIRTDWLFKVPLKNGMEVRRLDIIEELEGLKAGDPKITTLRLKLASLVQSNATLDMREHALKQGMSEPTFNAIQTKLDELFQAGIDKDSMSELNGLLDPVRDRIRSRLVEAGYFTADDPWTQIYGWTHYVPLKGAASEANDIVSQNAFDMIPDDKLSLARLNKQIEAMEGRKTFGQRPFERLFVDLARAGERSANRDFMESNYNLVLDNKSLGAKITAFKGSPRQGYTNPRILDKKTGEPVVFSSVPKPKHSAGFIFNDGDTHYSVELPRGGQLLRGLILMNATQRPGEFVKKYISAPTNFLARSYTTLSPFWQTAVGFVRDLTTIPLTVSIEHFDTPLQATKYLMSYGANVLQMYKAAPTFMANMKGDVNALEQMAHDDPGSYAAWAHRWEAGGGSNEYTRGFDLDSANDLFKNSVKDADGIWDTTKAAYGVALKYTGNWANFFEQLSRVAAFKALVESEGLGDKEAAVRVRQVLDYQQTGIWGRNINSFIAFYRVGMTDADTIRRAFRDKTTGGVNKSKLAYWSGTMSAIGALAYTMISASMGTDDDGKKKMHKLRASTLTQKMVIPVGDKLVGINMGLGMPQLLLSPGVLAAAVADGHLTLPEAAGEMWNTIMRNGPLRLAGMKDVTPTNAVASTVMGLTPTLISPVVELNSNIDSFDRPIHTEFDNPKLPHSEQARATTAKIYTEIARTLYDLGHSINSRINIDYYPEDIKYLMTNYGGQNVSDLLKATVDLDAKNAVGMDATYNVATNRFEVKDEDYYDQDRMYKLLDKAGESNRRYNTIINRALSDHTESEAKALGNQFLQDNPDEKAVIDAAKKLESVRKARSDALRKVAKDKTMSIGRKQAIRKEQDSKMRQATDAVQATLEKLN